MSNNTIICIFVEGETEKAFYKKVIEHIKARFKSDLTNCEIKYFNIEGISRFQNKALNRFKSKISGEHKYKNYKKIAVFCYDTDVFELSQAKPVVNWEKLERDFKDNGANITIHIKAKKSIEDTFLIDINGIVNFLKLKNTSINSLKGSGFEKMKQLFKKANRVYLKGTKVDGLVESLNIDLICKNQCQNYRSLCELLRRNQQKKCE